MAESFKFDPEKDSEELNKENFDLCYQQAEKISSQIEIGADNAQTISFFVRSVRLFNESHNSHQVDETTSNIAFEKLYDQGKLNSVLMQMLYEPKTQSAKIIFRNKDGSDLDLNSLIK